MKELFSVWLVPQKDDEEELTNTVNNLATEHSSPIFNPHLTLIGDVSVSYENLKSAVDETALNQSEFTVKSAGLNQSEAFFKTVFIEFEINETLKNLFQTLSQKTDKRSIDTFKPHISLMYKLMPEEEKRKIIQSLSVKNGYTMGSLYIVAPKVGDSDFMDVEGWRILYKKDLK